MRKVKKILAVLIAFTFIFQMCLPVYAEDSIQNLSLETGEAVTVKVPYYEDSYTVVNGVEPVLFTSTNSDVATAYKTGITMSSSGNSLSVEILAKTEGTTDIKISMRESGEILAQYAVTVTKSAASTLRLCEKEHTTISFKYKTKDYSYKLSDSSANLTIHERSTTQSSINGNYNSSTTMEISFGKIGEYVLTIYDGNNSIIIEYDVIIADHKWDSGVVTKEPTCSKEGSKKYTCQKCGVTEENSDDSPALGHDYPEEYTIDKEPTCTEKGQKSIHCTRCTIGRIKVTEIEPTGHTWSEEYSVDKEATCMENGQKSIHCTVCDAVNEDTIEEITPTGHEWAEGYTVDKEPTCTENGEKSIHCTICDTVKEDSVEEIAPTGHDWNDEYTIDKEATCTEDGQQSIHCKVCDAIDEDSIEEIEAAGHTWDEGEITKEPSYTEDGIKTFTCSVCGETKTESIDKLENPFVDVNEDDYFYDAVLWAYENGITSGKDDTHFAPSSSCTRAESATFLWRAYGQPEPETTENPFVDVNSSNYYYKAVLWAYENGITSGKDQTHFAPNDTVARKEFLTFLWRSAKKPEPETTDNPFVDVPDDAYYAKAVLWAYENGITTGKDESHFNPDGQCIRAQVVSFLYRYFG